MSGVAAYDCQSPSCDRSDRTSPSVAPRTVFCDFDGPIVDVSKRYYTTYKLALADTQSAYQAKGITLPIQQLEKQQFWQMKQDRVADEEIALRSGLQGEPIKFFLARVLEIVNQPLLLHLDKLQPGVHWALATLHSHGIRLILVTLRCQKQAEQILRNYGLTRLFSGIYGTYDHQAAYRNNAQVKQQLLVQALTEQDFFSLNPQSVWMIGDTEADLLAAQAVSIPTVALTCGIRSYRYLQQFQPNHTCYDLLTAADYLLEMIKPEK